MYPISLINYDISWKNCFRLWYHNFRIVENFTFLATYGVVAFRWTIEIAILIFRYVFLPCTHIAQKECSVSTGPLCITMRLWCVWCKIEAGTKSLELEVCTNLYWIKARICYSAYSTILFLAQNIWFCDVAAEPCSMIIHLRFLIKTVW